MLAMLISEFRNSIKSPETEEKLDLILYRPFGFVFAKIAKNLSMTPSMLSILGLFCGFIASYYFFENQVNSNYFLASLYFILSGIFDSSDGQLARISNSSSMIGLIIDGVCDSLVTIAIYISCAWPFIKNYGSYFALIVLAALYFHSLQCAILDFYHREYLYFGYGKTENDTYWNPGIEDGIKIIKASPSVYIKIMNVLRLTWINKQQLLTSRSDFERLTMRNYLLSCNDFAKMKFMESYRRNNLWLLPLWRLVGANAHTVLIIFFMFIKRFDVYILAFDLILLNLIIFFVSYFQCKADQSFMEELSLEIFGNE
jgi:hypothetical protein